MSSVPPVDRASQIVPASRREQTRAPAGGNQNQPADIDRRKTRRELPRTPEVPALTPPSPLGKIIDTFAVNPELRDSRRPPNHA